MKIPFDWKPNINEFQQVWDDLNKEPLHSGKLNFWRRVRLVCTYVQTLIKRMILNEKVNFSNENSTVNNTLDFIGDVFDEHDTRIKKNASDIDALEGRMDIAEEDIRNLKQADENFDDRVTTWEQQVQTNKANITILESRIEANTTELNEQNARLSTQEAELNSLQGDLEKTVIPDLNTAKNDIATLQSESAETKEAVEQMKAANAVVKFDITDKQSPYCDTELSQAIKVLNDGGKVAVANGTTNILSAEVNKIGESDIVVQVNSLEKTGDQWNITYNADGTKIEEASINPSVNAEDLQTVTDMINDLQRYINFTIDFNEKSVSCDVSFDEALNLINKGARVQVNNFVQPILLYTYTNDIIFTLLDIKKTGDAWIIAFNKLGNNKVEERAPSSYSNKLLIDERTGFIDITLDMDGGTGTSETSFADAIAAVKEGKELRCEQFTNILTRTAADNSAIYARIESANGVGKAYAITWNADGITCSEELPNVSSLNSYIDIECNYGDMHGWSDTTYQEAVEKLNNGARLRISGFTNIETKIDSDRIIARVRPTGENGATFLIEWTENNILVGEDNPIITIDDTYVTFDLVTNTTNMNKQLREAKKDLRSGGKLIFKDRQTGNDILGYNVSITNDTIESLFAISDGDTQKYYKAIISDSAINIKELPNNKSEESLPIKVITYDQFIEAAGTPPTISSDTDETALSYRDNVASILDIKDGDLCIYKYQEKYYFGSVIIPEFSKESNKLLLCIALTIPGALYNPGNNFSISKFKSYWHDDMIHITPQITIELSVSNSYSIRINKLNTNNGIEDNIIAKNIFNLHEHYNNLYKTGVSYPNNQNQWRILSSDKSTEIYCNNWSNMNYFLFSSVGNGLTASPEEYSFKTDFTTGTTVNKLLLDSYKTGRFTKINKTDSGYFYTPSSQMQFKKYDINGYITVEVQDGSVVFAPSKNFNLKTDTLPNVRAIYAEAGLTGDTISFSGQIVMVYFTPNKNIPDTIYGD